MKTETVTLVIFAIITLLLMPIWAPLAMAYCIVTGKSLRDVNGYNADISGSHEMAIRCMDRLSDF